MEREHDPIRSLREALAVTPGNVHLRLHLARELARLERYEEAEEEFRAVLAERADDDSVRLALARAYLAQGKTAHAAILVELITRRADASAESFLLLAKVRIDERDFQGARVAFRAACDLDPELHADGVAEELGMGLPNPFELEDAVDLESAFGEPSFDESSRRASWFPESAPDLGPSSGHPNDPSASPPGHEAWGPGQEPSLFADVDLDLELRRALPARPTPRMHDLGGYAAERLRIGMLVVEPLRRPELFASYGKRIVGGTLLLGPRGAGRTHLLQSVVGEAALALCRLDLAEILGGSSPGTPATAWSTRLVERFLDRALEAAPCVVLLENVDLLSVVAGDGEAAAFARRTLKLVTGLLDRMHTGGGDPRVSLVATSAAPWNIDPVLVQSGRFDRAVTLGLPDENDRRDMFRRLLSERPLDALDL
ncbi:MAG: AAA family ATPase, partial [Planctomycetota bacterium]